MKKIFGILICMLIVATVVPVAHGTENWIETQILFPVDRVNGDQMQFGDYISRSGDTVLIGAWSEDDNGVDSGAAYVFTLSGTTWTQQQKLLALDGSANDQFSSRAVALEGNTALIASAWDDDNGEDSGSVYVFTRTGTTWTQQTKLVPLDSRDHHYFGWALSLSGDTALISAYYDDDNGQYAGAAYVFTRTGTTWTQQQKLIASDGVASDYFGTSVCLEGNTAFIGTNTGSVYVFTRTGTTWTQQQKLVGPSTRTGSNFGCSLSLDSDTALIGATSENFDRGAVYVFTNTGTTWTQQQKLFASDSAESDYFGYSVFLDGDNAIIGKEYNGPAYIFTRNGNTWTEKAKLLNSNSSKSDGFGTTVSLSDDTALIGAKGQNNGEGLVYMFTKAGENQPPVASFIWTPATPTTNQQITFDASNSSDPDGSIPKYEWDWNNDGTYDNYLATPTFTYGWGKSGNYVVTLRVTDNSGATSTKTLTVQVSSSGSGDETQNKGTPGFELVVVISAIAIALFLLRKKRNL